MVAVTINEDENLIIVSGSVSIVRNGKRVEYPFSTEIRMGSDQQPTESKPVEPTTPTAFIKIAQHDQKPRSSKIEADSVHEFELFTSDSLKFIDRQKIEQLINDTYPARSNGKKSSSTTKEQFTQAACILAANILKASVNRQYLRYGKQIQFDHNMFHRLTRYHYDKITKIFEKAGIVTLVKQGYRSGKKGQSSLWEVSPNILNYKVSNESLLANHEPLKTTDFTDGKGVMTPEEEAEHAPHSRQRLTTIAPDFLKRINLPVVPPYRSFNDNGNLGGRVYCGMVQQISKAVRQETLRIDDQPTVEVDFSASHLQLLSKLVTGKWIEKADPYGFTLPNGQKADRDMCKEFFTRAPNASNVYGAMMKAGWTKVEYEQYRDGFKAAYPEIAGWFGTMAGCYLQKLEGDILETLMYKYLTEHNEILIPIHDAVICRQGIEHRVAQDMLRIRDEAVAQYSLEDMRDKLQLHDDVRRAILFEKNEWQKEKEKEAEETMFISDEEEGFVPSEVVTQRVDKVVKKFVITEELVQKAIEKVKRRANEVVGYINEESAFLDSDACPAEERNTKYLNALGRRIKSRGVEEETVMRLMRGLNDGTNIIGELYKEDVDLVRKHKRPKWFN